MSLQPHPYEDAATVRALIAIVRVALDMRGGVNSHFHGDVGRLLHPAALELRDAFRELPAVKYGPDWIGLFDAASGGSEYEMHAWLGKNLSHLSVQLEPMYRGILHALENRRDETPFEFAPDLRHLGAIFGLDEVEFRLLELAASLELSSFGFSYLDVKRPIARVRRAVAAAIGATPVQMQEALGRHGRLVKAGLLESEQGAHRPLNEILMLSDFGRCLLSRPHGKALQSAQTCAKHR